MTKMLKIFLNSIPVLVMVGLIPLIENDYMLALAYLLIISVSLGYKREKGDVQVLILGVVVMTFFEYIFLLTRVETFHRATLFGIMPLWLPILWGYGFVAIKRCVKVSE